MTVYLQLAMLLNKGASIAIAAIGEADRCVKVVDAYLKGEKLDLMSLI